MTRQPNPESTVPGVRGQGRSSAIGFGQLTDGELTDVHVAYVHVRMDLEAMGRIRGAVGNPAPAESVRVEYGGEL